MPNWKSPEARDRLMAAVVASMDVKALNYSRIAALFGQGTTYHAIEGQFRQVRKEAQRLKEELENGTTAADSRKNNNVAANSQSNGVGGGGRRKLGNSIGASGSNKRPKASNGGKTPSPSGRRDGILAGRVTKSKSITPTNGNGASRLTTAKSAMIDLDCELGSRNGTVQRGNLESNMVRGFKQEVESSDTSAANTPAHVDHFDLPFGAYDGACDLMYDPSFENPFGEPFGSDSSYCFES